MLPTAPRNASEARLLWCRATSAGTTDLLDNSRVCSSKRMAFDSFINQGSNLIPDAGYLPNNYDYIRCKPVTTGRVRSQVTSHLVNCLNCLWVRLLCQPQRCSNVGACLADLGQPYRSEQTRRTGSNNEPLLSWKHRLPTALVSAPTFKPILNNGGMSKLPSHPA